jgi:hypothetical protein
MMEKLKLSYSQATTFLICHKKWWWVYDQDLTSKKEKKPALQLGDVVHRLLDKYYRFELDTSDISALDKYVQKLYPQNSDEESITTARIAATLFYGYIKQFEEDDLRVVSPEMHLEKDFGDFSLYSRLDAVCLTPDDREWRMEHKTTSRMDSYYLNGLRKGLQTGIALWLYEDLVNPKVAGTVFNMLIKTKVPSYPRSPILKERWVINLAKEAVRGIVRDIKRRDFYPSANCSLYNEECEFAALCRNDTPQIRETFYTSRSKQVEKQKAIKQ